MTNDSPAPVHRGERVLAFMVAAAVGLSVLCFLAVILAPLFGLAKDQFSQPPWPTIIILPGIGLPIGLILMIALIVMSGVRRGREAKDASN